MATISGTGIVETKHLPEVFSSAMVNRGVIFRSAIVAVVIGSALTLTNQFGWAAGREPLRLLPLVLVFLTPFFVVAISQVVAARRALVDVVRHGQAASRESFLDTSISHGIPASALAIGLMIGSANALIVVAAALWQRGDLAGVSVTPLIQAYTLPLLFGILSQTISYRRTRKQL